jgi:hypothetical protein
MLSEGCRLLAMIGYFLWHTNFTKRMLIRPDCVRVPMTDNTAARPPISDRYDVMSRGSPWFGPPPVSSISSYDVAITLLWYPIPNRTDPSVAIIISFGSVISHPLGVSRVGMLPTKRWTGFGNACMQLPIRMCMCWADLVVLPRSASPRLGAHFLCNLPCVWCL